MLRAIVALLLGGFVALQAATSGIFEGSTDIGSPSHPGKALFRNGAYTIHGGGSNMWGNADSFYFAWKKVAGDFSLAADVLIPLETGGDPHRKAVLMIRQNLDADSAYADVAMHADGLTSLQYRESKGGRTYEIQANTRQPARLHIEKRGQYIAMLTAGNDVQLRPAGGSMRIPFTEPFYIGIGVCAHNDNRLERAVFSNVELSTNLPASDYLWSVLETVTIASKERRFVFARPGRMEAPNWAPDGSNLFVNAQGRIQRIAVSGGEPTTIYTGFAVRCNNDHGITPDGKTLIISDQSTPDRQSRIYTLPIEGLPSGSEPTLITKLGPSYWHGVAPDGKTLAYCAERNGEYDIYTISAQGGDETRLTSAKGLDDGPDYTSDGKWIYFNSDRTGQMHLWRMKHDGSQQEQVTNDEFNNWFPHPSPDGKWLVFLSYNKEVKGHPEDKDVTLRIMPLAGGKVEILAKLYGGQGTINVPSWSPDSKRVAFVSYLRR